MRLAKYIRGNKERILQDWECFARRLATAPEEMNTAELRDHAAGMLDFIVDVLESSAERDKAAEKLHEVAREAQEQSKAAAHGSDRRRWGFSIRDMVAEFRALRASVIRLWSRTTPRMNRRDLVTFDEAIDQALAESIDCYTSLKEHQTRLLESMLSFSSDQSAIFDLEGTILYANRALARAYDLHPRDIEGRSVDFLEAAFADEVRRQIAEVSSSAQECRGDFTITMRNGDVHVIDYLFAPILDKSGRVEAIAVNSRDITERRELERTLWKHANHDPLTGAPNRRLFFDRLEQDIRLIKRIGGMLAVLYIDLDKFKSANDRLGHKVGDRLLKQSAERIQACVRETDTIARMGGDEFTAILVGIGDREHVETVAQAILDRLSRPFSIDHESTSIGGSIGIAVYPEDADSTDDLTVRADQAMYVSKKAGGNRYRFYSVGDAARKPADQERGKVSEHGRNLRH